MGCGRKAPKRELVRYTAPGGVLARDPGHGPGRGAYTCPDPRCLERALARRAFARVLRAAVHVPRHLQVVSKEG